MKMCKLVLSILGSMLVGLIIGVIYKYFGFEVTTLILLIEINVNLILKYM